MSSLSGRSGGRPSLGLAGSVQHLGRVAVQAHPHAVGQVPRRAALSLRLNAIHPACCLIIFSEEGRSHQQMGAPVSVRRAAHVSMCALGDQKSAELDSPFRQAAVNAAALDADRTSPPPRRQVAVAGQWGPTESSPGHGSVPRACLEGLYAARLGRAEKFFHHALS